MEHEVYLYEKLEESSLESPLLNPVVQEIPLFVQSASLHCTGILAIIMAALNYPGPFCEQVGILTDTPTASTDISIYWGRI